VERTPASPPKPTAFETIGVCSPEATDLSRYTAIPGMIDAHTHLTYVLDNSVNQSARSAAVVFLSQDKTPAKRSRPASPRCAIFGAADYADIAMRDLINSGQMAGPRMFVSGYGLTVSRGRTPSPWHGRRRRGRPARSSPADRSRRGLRQDVWLNRIGARRQRVSRRSRLKK